MLKRYLTLILGCLLVCTMLFGIVGCDNTPSNPSGNTPGGDTPGEDVTGPTGDAAVDFTVVRADGTAAMSASIKIRKAMASVTGKTVSSVAAAESQENAQAKEILVGATGRPESVDAMNGLKENEYVIRIVGNKIVLAGGSNASLEVAVDQFLLNYVGYCSDAEYTENKDLTFPQTLDIKRAINHTENIAVLQLSESVDYVNRLQKSLSGYYKNVSLETMASNMNDVFDYDFNRVVVIAGAEVAPVKIRQAMAAYLNKGGRVLILGGPAFETYLYEKDGEWMEASDFWGAVSRDVPAGQKHVLFDTTDENCVEKFQRTSGKPSREVYHYFGDFGLQGSDCQMFYEVYDWDSWEGFGVTTEGVPAGVNALGFWAKSGDPNTEHVGLQMYDAYGARWTMALTLSDEWEYYMITPNEFKWYSDSKKPQFDYPTYDDVTKFIFEFANTTMPMTKGYHSIYLAEPTFFKLSGDENTMIESIGTDLEIDGISPLYEQYPVTNAANLVTEDNQVFLTERDYTIPTTLISCHPGRQGTGYGKERVSRFIPLIRITDEKGLHSGYAAWINLFSGNTSLNGDIEGSMVGCFSACSNDFYDTNGILAVTETVSAMTSPAYLVEGGTDEYRYIPADEPNIVFGSSYIDFDNTANMDVSVALYDGDTLLKEIRVADAKKVQRKNGLKAFESTYPITEGRPDRAVTTLTIDGVVVDRIEQEIRYWEAKPESERNYIYVEDGNYMRDGEIITFFGINYIPTYNLAEPWYNNFEFYTRKSSYDPEVVWQDLLHMKDIGYNAVSVGLHGTADKVDSNNMLDLICMCEELGIYVDLAIRSTNKYDKYIYFTEQAGRDLVLLQHFYENDNIIAYDLCWERGVGSYEGGFLGRKRWDADWRTWIDNQYGSVEHAEKLWGCSVTRDTSGQVIGLSDSIINDPTRSQFAMVAAYYRFMDDMVAKEFAELTNYIKSLDPNHLLSFRMSLSGNAQATNSNYPSRGYYDFQSLASTMDFMSPEAYGVSGNEDSMLQLVFANAYARYTSPDAPVVWKEFGPRVWNGSNFTENSLLDLQKTYYELFYEYAFNSYTGAIYSWWYAGGYRYNENSDCGVLNPDGSDRPCTAVVREYAEKFINQGKRPEADVVIEIERDKAGRGIYGMYDAIKNQLRAAYNNGKTVALVNAQQGDEEAGKFYADETLTMALGNTKAEGQFPLRYVNGQFKDVEVVKENGQTYLKVTACNTLQSTWREGTVSVVSTANSAISVRKTIDAEVGYLDEVVLMIPVTGTGTVDLRFEIGGIQFGMNCKLTVK